MNNLENYYYSLISSPKGTYYEYRDRNAHPDEKSGCVEVIMSNGKLIMITHTWSMMRPCMGKEILRKNEYVFSEINSEDIDDRFKESKPFRFFD